METSQKLREDHACAPKREAVCSATKPDLTTLRQAEAERFLTLLDEEAETFCFQTFDDGCGLDVMYFRGVCYNLL